MKTNEIPAAASSRSDMLRDVRGFIERGWTQNVGARIEDGRGTYPDDPRAVCWCLVGAAMVIEPHFKTASAQEVARALGFGDPSAMALWNDRPHRTKTEVLARIDRALEPAGGGA